MFLIEDQKKKEKKNFSHIKVIFFKTLQDKHKEDTLTDSGESFLIIHA